MKSILHVIDTTGPGGAETVFVQLVEASVAMGWNTIALVRGPGWVKTSLNQTGAKILEIDCKGSFNFTYLRRLIDIVKQEKIEVIQSHLLGSNVYCSIVGLLTGVAVVSTFHGLVDIQKKERYRFIKLWFVKKGSRYTVAVTEALKEFIEHKSPLRNTLVIYNGVDATRFQRISDNTSRAQFDVPEDALLLGALGNVRRAKNYKLAVEAVRHLVQSGIEAYLLIAGDDRGVLADELREFVRQRGLENRVVLTGFIDDTPAFLSSLDIYILSSSSEGHPLALTQAMCVGVPVVATRCGVEEVLVDGEEAILVENENFTALAEGIMRVYRGEVRADNLARNAREKALKLFSNESMIDGYFKLYG